MYILILINDWVKIRYSFSTHLRFSKSENYSDLSPTDRAINYFNFPTDLEPKSAAAKVISAAKII